MPQASLPDHPDPELLKKRAKELVRAARAAEPGALERLRGVPRLARATAAQVAVEVRLADAQHALAREHGCASWPALLRHLAAVTPAAVQAERLVRAVRHGDAAAARRLARLGAEVGAASVAAACVTGHAAALEAFLGRDPAAATAPVEGWPPLLYAAASPLHERAPAVAAGLLRCVELLLARGGDPNTFVLFDAGDPTSKLPALYFAAAGGQTRVVERLLAAGAEPNDGESIYHAAELDRRACLELLVRHGADPSGRHPRWGNTPLYFLAGYREDQQGAAKATRGMAWLLAHGADPDVPSGAARETPLHRVAAHGRRREVAEMLLAHGAAVDAERADGRTAYVLALRSGNAPLAEALRAAGAEVARATPTDRFLGACLAADAASAEALLAADPELLARFSDHDRELVARAAGDGRDAALRLMARLGVPLDWPGDLGASPLHWAAWFGRPAAVRTLVERGAAIDSRDPEFGSSPLAWAAHGSSNCRRADADYCAVVDLLLDAGATRDPAINRWGEPPESMATRPVTARLRARGFVPPA